METSQKKLNSLKLHTQNFVTQKLAWLNIINNIFEFSVEKYTRNSDLFSCNKNYVYRCNLCLILKTVF